ncbi:MAG: hypothetical protein ABSE45_08635 [Candidatus Acidiferrales bacterium]|jgi:hypothetical protein
MAGTDRFTKFYRILTWVSLGGLVLLIVLVLRKSPPPNVPNDPAAAARAEQKFAAADEAKAAGQQPAQVALDRTELNSYLQQNLQTEGSSLASVAAASAPAAAPEEEPTIDQVQSAVKDVKVDMDGDLVKAYVVYNLHGQNMSLELDGHLSAENGYLKFDPVAGKLGSLPLPQATLDAAVQKLMASPENREKLKLPDNVSDIQIQNGQAVVSYK